MAFMAFGDASNDLSLLLSVQKNIPVVFMINPSLIRQCFLPIKSIHLL